MRYRPTADEEEVARLIARRRDTLNGGRPVGHEVSQSRSASQHLRAALSEIAVSRLFNLAWTGCGKGSDGVPDVGGVLEVRSVDASTPTYGLTYKEGKDRPEAPGVLVSVDMASLWCDLIGWHWMYEVRSLGVDRGIGPHGGSWFTLRRELLLPMRDLAWYLWMASGNLKNGTLSD